MKRILIILGLLAIPLTSISAVQTANANPKEPNITFCHRTASFSNPYVKITTDANSIFKKGHDGHDGPVFDGHTKPWGDIIPPFTYNEGTYPGKNYSAEGKAILDNGCKVTTSEPTPTPSVSVSPTGTPTPTVTESPTPSPSATPTATTVPTETPGPTVAPTKSPVVHPTPQGNLPMTGFDRGDFIALGVVLILIGIVFWAFARLP